MNRDVPPMRLILTCRGTRLFGVGFGAPAPVVEIATQFGGARTSPATVFLDGDRFVEAARPLRETRLADCPHHPPGHVISAAALQSAMGEHYSPTGKSAARCVVARVEAADQRS
jgi:hypothetical protein